MSTAAQKRANRENAKRSTGPRTPKGKKRTSLNALKHGLCAKEPLIPGEKRAVYEDLYLEFESELKPCSRIEFELFEQIVDLTWRLKRCTRIETAIINELYDTAAEQPGCEGKADDELIGKMFAHDDSMVALNRLSRHEACLARRYLNAMKEFREIRTRRIRSMNFSGLASGIRERMRAEAEKEADGPPEAQGEKETTEPTQSAATPVESAASMKPPVSEPASTTLDPAAFPPTYAESPGPNGRQEAVK